MSPVRPLAFIVMGVSGSGKTTIANGIGKALGIDVLEGDSYHSAANIEKMKHGIPLDDADRMPWLRAIATAIGAELDEHRSCIVACSALKRSYREILIGKRDDVVIVYLKGSRELIAARLQARKGHFMPPELLASQFATLEEPEADEHPITVSVEGTPEQIVGEVLTEMRDRSLIR
ncbi:MAG TPA: gluconokinase [Acetobacteraceae bacterium]|nr:gluconokinase [Acetobacteraceae bacterium]